MQQKHVPRQPRAGLFSADQDSVQANQTQATQGAACDSQQLQLYDAIFDDS